MKFPNFNVFLENLEVLVITVASVIYGIIQTIHVVQRMAPPALPRQNAFQQPDRELHISPPPHHPAHPRLPILPVNEEPNPVQLRRSRIIRKTPNRINL